VNVEQLIGTYPRSRPPLSTRWQERYTHVYKEGREGRTLLYGLTQLLERWMHRRVAGGAAAGRVLELGAGTLNHVRYEAERAEYDVVEPFIELYRGKAEAARVRRFYRDIAEIESGSRYDRIVSVATLEHITDLPMAMARAALLLAPGGEFRAGIPSEGGFLWGASWRCTVGLSCRVRYGLDYGELMRHEHVNSAPEIIELARYLFRECSVARFPLPLHHLSLYSVLIARNPVVDRCKALLLNEVQAHEDQREPAGVAPR
jgi:SAM-dependent methyltransferase